MTNIVSCHPWIINSTTSEGWRTCLVSLGRTRTRNFGSGGMRQPMHVSSNCAAYHAPSIHFHMIFKDKLNFDPKELNTWPELQLFQRNTQILLYRGRWCVRERAMYFAVRICACLSCDGLLKGRHHQSSWRSWWQRVVSICWAAVMRIL